MSLLLFWKEAGEPPPAEDPVAFGGGWVQVEPKKKKGRHNIFNRGLAFKPEK